MGCTSSTPANSHPQNSPISDPPRQTAPSSSAGMQSDRAQQLPISAQTTLAEQLIQLEVARTPQEQALGLMYRTSLADDRGMLFPFDPPRPVSFWMKNVAIHLDMIFIRDGEIVAIAENVPPCITPECPTYGPSQVPVEYVIELRGGRANQLGLAVGDRVDIEFLDSDRTSSTSIRF